MTSAVVAVSIRRGRSWPRWLLRLGYFPGSSRRGPAAPPAGPDSCPPALSPRPWRNRRASSCCTPGWNGKSIPSCQGEINRVFQPPPQLREVRVYSPGCKQGCFQPPPVARRFHCADSPIWRFCPGFGQIGGKRLHCKPILGTWLSWVVQDITWPLNTASVPCVVVRFWRSPPVTHRVQYGCNC